MARPVDTVEDRYRTGMWVAALLASVAWAGFLLVDDGGRPYLVAGLVLTVVAGTYRVLVELRRAHLEIESARVQARPRSG